MPYKFIKKDGKLIQEHRAIAQEILRRDLKDEEKIHHINHDRSDNRPENLMLFESQKLHKSFENKQLRFGNTRYVIEEINRRVITNLL